LPVIFNQNISIQNLQIVAEHHNVHSTDLQNAKRKVKHIAQYKILFTIFRTAHFMLSS